MHKGEEPLPGLLTMSLERMNGGKPHFRMMHRAISIPHLPVNTISAAIEHAPSSLFVHIVQIGIHAINDFHGTVGHGDFLKVSGEHAVQQPVLALQIEEVVCRISMREDEHEMGHVHASSLTEDLGEGRAKGGDQQG